MKPRNLLLPLCVVLLFAAQTAEAQVRYRIEGRFGHVDFSGRLEIVDVFGNRTVDTLEVVNGTITPIKGKIDEMTCCVLREIHRENGKVYPYLFIDKGTTRIEGTDERGVLLLSGTDVCEEMERFREVYEKISQKRAKGQISGLSSKEEKCRLAYDVISRHTHDVYGLWLLINSGNLYLKSTQWLELDERIQSSLNERIKANAFLMKDLSNMRAKMNARKNTEAGNKFVDFAVEYEGQTVRLSDYVGKGKYVLLDFWASWCGPCRQEIPNLIEVYDRYKDEGLQVLGIAVWDKPEDSLRAIEEEQLPYPQMINAQKIPTRLYGISAIPEIILFAPDGTILERGLRGEEIIATLSDIFDAL